MKKINKIIIFPISFLLMLFVLPKNVKAQAYACTPWNCSVAKCYNACTASLDGKVIRWSGSSYIVPDGCYSIVNKCPNVDKISQGLPCSCPLENITCATCEGYDTCNLPEVERYFIRDPVGSVGWEENYCGTQQVDVNCGGNSYFHSKADVSIDTCNPPSPTPVPPTPTPTPTPAPPKTCTVNVSPDEVNEGQTVGVSLKGNGNDSSLRKVRLWLERKTGQEIPDYAVSVSPKPEPFGTNPTYYEITSGDCLSWNHNSCSTLTNLRAPTGDYYVHCDIPGDTPCTGNPFCDFKGGSLSCEGFQECSKTDNASFTVVAAPSCDISVSVSPSIIPLNSKATLIANVTPYNGTIDYVRFSSQNGLVATPDDSRVDASPFLTQATSHNVGSTKLVATAYMGGVPKCACNLAPNNNCPEIAVTNASSWWQVKDADVFTNGSLKSSVPPSAIDPTFDLNGSGGYPGVPSYLGSVDFGGGKVSETSWVANTLTLVKERYNYSFFEKLIPSDASLNEILLSSVHGDYFTDPIRTHDPKGYYWFRYDGSALGSDFNITSDAQLGTKKVILLVKNANLNVNGKVNLTKGQGLFMAVVQKSINIAGAVGGGPGPDLEGLFVTDENFNTGVSNLALSIRGSVVAYGGITLSRSLADNSKTPAEFFEYAPDLVFLYPHGLYTRQIKWKEIAP
jgi:hypothetical protein